MKEGVALKQLADVLPPPPPSSAWILWVVAGVTALVAATVLLWVMSKRRSRQGDIPAREAQRRLAALRSAWQSQVISDREAAYRLATLLRLGLGLSQLAPQLKPTAVEDDTAWYDTLGELQALRYRDRSNPLSPRCFDRAEQWLAAAQRGDR